MSPFIIFNGQALPAGDPVFTADNRSFRYGDGLFETIRLQHGIPRLGSLHFNRLFTGLAILGIVPGAGITPEILTKELQQLCARNSHPLEARVRLTVFRSAETRQIPDVGIPHYLIESFPMPPPENLPVRLCFYEDDRKSTGRLSNLKSNNYLLYVMAGQSALQQGCDEAVILNHHDRVCDSQRANVFLIKDGLLATPALSEGCVAGVMRRHIITLLHGMGLEVMEREITRAELIDADEVFLTNALHPMRSAMSLGGKQYNNEISTQLASIIKWN